MNGKDKKMSLVVIRFIGSPKSQVCNVTHPHEKKYIFPDRMLTLKMAFSFFYHSGRPYARLMRMIPFLLVWHAEFFRYRKKMILAG